MTIATILTKMQVLNNELDVAVGGADESRCISALDMAQDAFESILANHPDTLGTISTISTTANQEYTTWPSTLMRLDTLWLMNTQGTPNRPQWEIRVIQDVGGQASGPYWPSGYNPQGYGQPMETYTNRQYFFWAPIPDQVYTLRAYGLSSASDIATRGATFAYPDNVSLPMAACAVQMLKMGIDDPSEAMEALADKFYAPVINMLRQPTRQRPQSRVFSRIHTT